jgi:hypothetical protein
MPMKVYLLMALISAIAAVSYRKSPDAGSEKTS